MFNAVNHGIRNRLLALLAGVLALSAISNSAIAIDAPSAVLLQSTSTDGKTYGSTFSVNLTAANSTTSLASALVDQAVQITATYNPGTAHANQLVDIFVVERMNNAFYMRTLDGVFVPWTYPNIAELKPAKEHVKLTPGLQVEVYSGTYNAAAVHNIFVGYMVVGGSTLIYTPAPANFEIKTPTSTVAPLTYFTDHVENDILPRCRACHFSSGLAKDSMLILAPSSATSAKSNFDTFGKVAQAKGVGYILTKVTGGNSHVGGVQLALGSTDYNNLATFLQLQQGTTEVITAAGSALFDGVTLQTRAETLRRAAILLAGRAPTQGEIDVVSKGDESTLRTTLRSLMTGDGFHQFLTDGTNDRLLVRGVQGLVIDSNYPFYPKLTTEIYNLKLQARNAGKSQAEIDRAGNTLGGQVDAGLRRSVDELVAHVVETDRPYTEVLTADYMMMSPKVNFVMEGGATFKNPNNPNEFQPGKVYNSFVIKGDRFMENDKVLGWHFTVQPTIRHPWEHVGILNNAAFMARYPSTATNRNRARARWTMLNFLDIDIEKSTQRPTDPAALADRNNPTMNNPACYACHERMDPVAATFQNYSDAGFYRDSYDDSLDNLYKYPVNNGPTLYVKGDTWYRDMRPPGLLGQSISTATEPLKQLAALITKDKGFASATVKFWWPSVMNSDVLILPVVTTDSNYQAKLDAYQAQSASIEQFATNFRKDYNLKNLLVDMMMSPWFRARSTTNTSQRAAMAIADVGVEKLLTPERLQRKAVALTGFNWGSSNRPSDPYTIDSSLGTGYNSYNGIYGGIDSSSVITRARDITPLMSTVAQSFALESSCPIVMKEFALTDGLRKLFSGLNQNVTPQWQGTSTAEVTSTSATDWKTLSLTVDLGVGSNQLALTLDNSYCDFDQATQKCRTQRILYLDRFEIKAPGQSSFQPFEITQTMIKNFPTGCYQFNSTDALTFGQCAIPLDINVLTAGTYQIRAIVSGVQAGTGNIAASLTVRDAGDALLSTSRGATLIRQKLVELFKKLHGKTYAIDAPEITTAYKLFVDTWQEKIILKAGTSLNSSTKTCAWNSDINFFDGLGVSANVRIPNTNGTDSYMFDANVTNAFFNNSGATNDPLYVKQSWTVVMAYLLGHYNFLYE